MMMSVLCKDAISSLGQDVQESFGNGSLDAFLYADDTLLVGVSQQGVQELLDAVAQTGARYGMELHWNKFQLLQIGAVYHLVTPNGSVIPPSEVMTYLGTAIYADGAIKRELNSKLGRALADFSKPARLWNHASLRKERKILMYKAVVVSRLLYGLNTAWLNVAEQRRLNGFHCRCLRKIVGIPSAYISRVSNARVLKEAQEAPLERQLSRQQLLLYGRLIRAPSADPLRKLTFIDGMDQPTTTMFVRKRGRPRNTWTAMLQRECFKMGTAYHRTVHTEQEWQATVYAHCIG